MWLTNITGKKNNIIIIIIIIINNNNNINKQTNKENQVVEIYSYNISFIQFHQMLRNFLFKMKTEISDVIVT